MLDEQDIKKIGDILEEKIGVAIEEKVRPIVKAEVSSIVKSEIAPMVKAEIHASEDRIIVAVGEMIEQNVIPVMDKMDGRMDKMDGKLDDMRKTIANLPDKAYLDAKLADREGTTVVRQKTQNQKVNLTIDFLGKKKVFGEQEMQQLNAIHVFPSPPAVI